MTNQMPNDEAVSTPAVTPVTQVAEAKEPVTVGQVLRIVWLSGVGLMALWFLGVNLLYNRRVRRSAEPWAVEGSPIPVMVSDTIQSPCLLGFFRPRVYLTMACAADPEATRHVLAHELTHYRHGDLLWSVVRSACLCLHWYNPLVWWAASLSRRDCELACDEGALKKLGEKERLPYGRTLVAMIARAATPVNLLQTATTMAANKKQLKERVTMIAKKRKLYTVVSVVLLLVIGTVVGCTFAGAEIKPAEDPENDIPSVQSDPTETTEEPSTEPSTEPSETEFVPPEGTLLTDEDLARYQQMFSGQLDSYAIHSYNWYNIALAVEFDCPENVDWNIFFTNGTKRSDDPLSDAEMAFVEAGGFPMDKDIRRLPAAEMDAIAMQYFGLTIAESNQVGIDQILYFPDTDCYYAHGGGAILMDGFVIHSGAVLEDGTIRLYYSEPIYGERVITLKSRMSEGETGYYILSNLPLSKVHSSEAVLELPEDGMDLNSYLIEAGVRNRQDARGEGRLTVTDLTTGETASMDGYLLDWCAERLYWSEATTDAEFALSGATCIVRLENVETGWYVELHNGENGEYIYSSEYNVYVPARVDDPMLGNMRVDVFAERATMWLLNQKALSESASDAYVVDALDLQYTYDWAELDLRLPRIQLPMEGIEEINKEIMLTYSETFFGVNSPDNKMVVDYVWAVNGDILSVAVIPANNETWTMSAYNFSISEKRRLSNEEVYAACGLSNIQTRVSHAIACATGEYLFMDENGKIDVQKDGYLFQEGNVEFTISCFANGISQENFERATPYLDEQGRLWVVADVYQMAGASDHKESICVEDYDTDVLHTAEEYFNYYADMVG